VARVCAGRSQDTPPHCPRSADDLKSLASARMMVVGLRREINVYDVRIGNGSITLNDLSRHYQQRELLNRNSARFVFDKKNLCRLPEEVDRASMGCTRALGHSSRRSGGVAEEPRSSTMITVQDTEHYESAVQPWASPRPLRTQPY